MSIARNDPAVCRMDPVWERIRTEAVEMADREPVMGSLAHAAVLQHPSFEAALSHRIAQKLADPDIPLFNLFDLAQEALSAEPDIGAAARADIAAVYERDPACSRYVQPLLFFKGFLALQSHRVAHWLWRNGRADPALLIQSRASELFSVDIHPNARIGRGIMIDHAHAIVVGETSVIGDNCSMLHSVTLGGTGKAGGDRHPKIGHGVLLGAGAKVLGNISVGHCSRVAAGSVVLADVPPCKTVAGVPARIVGDAGCDQPSLAMNHVV